MSSEMSRRNFLKGFGVATSSAAFGAIAADVARAVDTDPVAAWIAKPPAGFQPLQLPGRVVQVEKNGSFEAMMQSNQLWPKPELAGKMLERVLTELTGKSTLPLALGEFIHSQDTVAVKVNGISGQTGYTMAVNFELILPLVQALLTLGVPAEKVTVFEQFPNFLQGTRVGVKANQLPDQVNVASHNNRDAKMPKVRVFHRVETRFVRQVTDATAIIDMTMMKDHSLCGFTGALKNMTHGQIINPHDHHAHRCDPQIPLLYNHPVLRSRVRLHIVDAFKIIYDQGPLDKNPNKRIPHGSVYASTDPVALDRIGLKVIEDARKEHGAPLLADVRREASYVRTAGELGLGVYDLNMIRLRRVTI